MDGIQIEKEADMNTPPPFHPFRRHCRDACIYLYFETSFLLLWPLSLYFKFTFTHRWQKNQLRIFRRIQGIEPATVGSPGKPLSLMCPTCLCLSTAQRPLSRLYLQAACSCWLASSCAQAEFSPTIPIMKIKTCGRGRSR